MIHKKILDAAESQPSASVEELAAAVNGASADLVERVLEEYGDPAESGEAAGGAEEDASEKQPHMEHAKTTQSADGVGTQTEGGPNDPPALTMKQRDALRAIRESPEATQGELAERFDVTQSTINNRLNTIEGFDWKRRLSFAEAALGDTPARAASEPGDESAGVATVTNGALTDGDEERGVEPASGDPKTSDARVDDSETDGRAGAESGDGSVSDDAARAGFDSEELLLRLDELSAQVAALERRLGDSSAGAGALSPLREPDLACKVVRACFDSPDITENEEDRILKAVIGSDGGT